MDRFWNGQYDGPLDLVVILAALIVLAFLDVWRRSR